MKFARILLSAGLILIGASHSFGQGQEDVDEVCGAEAFIVTVLDDQGLSIEEVTLDASFGGVSRCTVTLALGSELQNLRDRLESVLQMVSDQDVVDCAKKTRRSLRELDDLNFTYRVSTGVDAFQWEGNAEPLSWRWSVDKLSASMAALVAEARLGDEALVQSLKACALEVNNWGAMAQSSQYPDMVGMAARRETKEEAERSAVSLCRADDCKVLLSYYDTCGAFATSLYRDVLRTGAGKGPNILGREVEAQCNEAAKPSYCNNLYVSCSDGWNGE